MKERMQEFRLFRMPVSGGARRREDVQDTQSPSMIWRSTSIALWLLRTTTPEARRQPTAANTDATHGNMVALHFGVLLFRKPNVPYRRRANDV